MKIKKIGLLLLLLCMCMSFVIFPAAAAQPIDYGGGVSRTRTIQDLSKTKFTLGAEGGALYAASFESDLSEEIIIDNDIITPRSDKWPVQSWDITKKGKYTGRIGNISNGFGVYTNYYFNCNSAGKLEVTATLTATHTLPTNSKCIIEIYDAVTKKLIGSYDPGFESYDNTTISHVFTDLETGTPYVVRFYNATEATFPNSLSGPISVGFP